MDEAYLAFIWPIKDEEQKVMFVVPEKSAMGCDVEMHKDMPEKIKVVQREYKDIFPMDLPPDCRWCEWLMSSGLH